ncbi:hypothetical protein WEI85_46010 [Actinomycetes bacterium KLBMP 9797]
MYRFALFRTPSGVCIALTGLAAASALAWAGLQLGGSYRTPGVVGGLLLLAWVALVLAFVPPLPARLTRAERQAVVADLPADAVARGKRFYADLRLSRFSPLLRVLIGIALGLTPAGSTAVTWLAGPLDDSWVAQALAAGVLLSLAYLAIGLPIEIHARQVKARHGKSIGGYQEFLQQYFALARSKMTRRTVALLAFCALAIHAPDRWWTGVALAAIIMLYQRYIEPLSAVQALPPLPDGQLRDQLFALADRCGVALRQVHVRPDSSGVPGGSLYRIDGYHLVLDAGAITAPDGEQESGRDAGPSDSETLLLAAHELGHGRERYWALNNGLLAIKFVAIACGVYLLNGWDALFALARADSLADPRAIGLLALLLAIIDIAIALVRNWVCRRLEAGADQFAFDVTGDPAALERIWSGFEHGLGWAMLRGADRGAETEIPGGKGLPGKARRDRG